MRLKKSSKNPIHSIIPTFQLLRTTRTPLHSFRLISLSTKNPIHSIYSILLIILIILSGNSLIVIAANDFSYSRMLTYSIAPNPTISKKKKNSYTSKIPSALWHSKNSSKSYPWYAAPYDIGVKNSYAISLPSSQPSTISIWFVSLLGQQTILPIMHIHSVYAFATRLH